MEDKDSYIIQPKPPAEPKQPRTFDYWQKRRLPLIFIGCGGLLLAGALLVLAYVLSTTLDEDTPDTQTVDATVVEPSATIYVVGGTRTRSVQVTVVTRTPTTAETALDFPTATREHDLPTATFTFSPPTHIPPTHTPLPSLTRTPTWTFTPTATSTATATPTITLSATNTPLTQVATNTATRTLTPSITMTPTPTQAQGRLVRLYYDQNSFYAFNASQQDIHSSPFTFEAVDAAGVFAGYRLEGQRWSAFYPYLEDRNCNAIEITQAFQWLRPVQCRFYNAILTPERRYEIVFWLERPGVAAFRVLYDEQEIAKCPVGEGTCDIYVP